MREDRQWISIQDRFGRGFCHVFFIRFFIFLQNKALYKHIQVSYLNYGGVFFLKITVFKQAGYKSSSLKQERTRTAWFSQAFSYFWKKRASREIIAGLILKNREHVFPIPLRKSIRLAGYSENHHQKLPSTGGREQLHSNIYYHFSLSHEKHVNTFRRK